MLTKKDLQNLDYLEREIAYYDSKIENYKPAEVVVDSVGGSDAQFPYVQHTFTIEGIEHKRGIDEYLDKRINFRKQLREEKQRIEDELEQIENSKIRQIIQLRYIERKSWNEVADGLDMPSEDSARMTLNRFLDEQNETRGN